MRQILAGDVEVGDMIMISYRPKTFQKIIEIRPRKSVVEIETESDTYEVSPVALVVIRG